MNTQVELFQYYMCMTSWDAAPDQYAFFRFPFHVHHFSNLFLCMLLPV